MYIMDACFSAKRFKSSGEQVHNAWLDQLYYIPMPTKIRNDLNFSESCSNFRAGDLRLKAGKDVDVSAVFAAVCVHGFVYRIIGNFNQNFVILIFRYCQRRGDGIFRYHY